MKLFIYSALLLLLGPCNKTKEVGSSTPDHSKVLITYQATACFGKCPMYKLTINGESKTATFMGEQNVEKIGTYTKPVTDQELSDFVAAFDKAKFTSMNNEYLGPIPDFPMKVISYTNNGSTKVVKGRSHEPAELLTLEKMLNDYALSEEGWKKTSDSSNSKD